MGGWDGSATKLGYDDHCTTIKVINSLSNKKNVVAMKIETMVVTKRRGITAE